MSPTTKRKINLGLFLRPTGHHVAGWRHPTAVADAGRNFEHFVEMARLGERGLFDLLFCADIATVWSGNNDSLSRTGTLARVEPFTLMTALAVVTERIGLVCTASTTYEEPFNLARRFASLDIISNGRAGWNLVTSRHEAEAANFGRDERMEKGARYKRGLEFARVVQGLWDSWDDDAFIRDKADGRFFDPRKLHTLDHKGEFFSVRGPLNVPPCPQRYPVMVQAGASDEGREVAAETAEVVFAAHPGIDQARPYYADIKSRMAKYGRDPGHLKILPGLVPFVGRTREEARAKFEQIQDLIHPEVGVRMLSHYIGYDLSGFDVDGPLPPIPAEKAQHATRTQLLASLAEREGLTIRGLYKRVAGGRGHFQVVGSPADVADTIEAWVDGGAADGFNIMPAHFPGGLVDFVELVIPELQRRGRFRTAYEGPMLRDQLDLPRPKSRYASGPG